MGFLSTYTLPTPTDSCRPIATFAAIMHTNYYFLRQLAPALHQRLAGLRLMEVYSQHRDEVVLVLAAAKGKQQYYKPAYLTATLRPDFSGVYAPETLRRARHNSVDVLPEAVGDEAGTRTVVGVRAFLNERALGIALTDGYTLVFTFFGNRPNLLLFQENDVVDVFNRQLTTDRNLNLSALDRPFDQTYRAYEQAGFDHRPLFPTFGKVLNQWLDETPTPPGPARWQRIEALLEQLETPTYYLTQLDYKPVLSLVPIGLVQAAFDEPVEAANRFFSAYQTQTRLAREKADWLKRLDKRRKHLDNLLEINRLRLVAQDDQLSHEQKGHLLMANLHNLDSPAGQQSPERVLLTDFYHNRPVELKLKPDLSPQRNAEHFYRKAKNEKIEQAHLEQRIAEWETEKAQLVQHRTAIESYTSVPELRRYVKAQHLTAEAGKAADAAELFKEMSIEGFRVLIGRNARNNDLLTQKYTYKDDLWLHARDVSGSHVVIKYRAGKPFPRTVVERAAEVAAWYSRRRTDSLCPVTVTPKKYVRKPKGLAEGQVVIDKEEAVLLVVPRSE